MKPLFFALLAASTCACVTGFSSLLAVQNAAPVSIRFLQLESIRLPLGLLLTMGVMAGMLGVLGLQLVLSVGKRP